ncbi:MAG: hypothetical protein A2Y91_02230 [Chloroflexi bacterium RBG_13_54_8]|nr:MAG: hypothetical protein A2Y91_02230 [Chloroflexi bacterium RBG_13_54_8]
MSTREKLVPQRSLNRVSSINLFRKTRQIVEEPIQDNPYEVIDAPKVLERRKTFKGKCSVCQG